MKFQCPSCGVSSQVKGGGRPTTSVTILIVCALAVGYGVWDLRMSPSAGVRAAAALLSSGDAAGAAARLEGIAAHSAAARRWLSAARLAEGWGAMRAGEYGKATAALGAAGAADPSNAEAWYLQGFTTRAGSGPREVRLRQALEMFRKAAALESGEAEYHRLVAATLLQLGQPAEALSEARKAVASEPNEARHRNLLARAVAAAGQSREAIPEYQRAMRLDIDDIQPRDAADRTRRLLARYMEDL